MAEGQQEQLRTVLLVNIEKGSDAAGLFEDMYKGLSKLLKDLKDKSIRLIIVTSVEELGVQLVKAKPKVLLFTNEVVAKKSFKQFDAVKNFISEGGLAVLACHFSSFIRPPSLNRFLNSFGLAWKSGAYNRTTFGKTPVGKLILDGVKINTVEKMNVKAAQLSDVPPDQMLYVPVEGAMTNSLVFAPEPANPGMTMAAFGRVGKGAIAYVGDVNAEDESNILTVALCLVDW